MIRTIGAILVTGVCLLTVASCGGSSGGTPAPPVISGTGVERIDQAMNSVMDRHAPPGIAVAVVREGKLVYANAFGSADIAGDVPLRPDHDFRVASVSKPVTAIAALRAMEEGLLNVERQAFDILSDYLPASGADPRIMDITVRNLLHHTGGWDLYGYPSDPLFRSDEVALDLGVAMPPGPADLVRWIARQPLVFDPGGDFAYTNIGYVVLGRVIEQTSGFRYEDFVRQFVLEPAGIGEAFLGGITRAARAANEVEYESFSNDIWRSIFDGRTVVSEPAYGGLNLIGFDASSAWVFSAVDLVRLAAATDGDAAYPDILRPETVAMMTTTGTPPGATPVGAAWFLETDSSGRVIGWNHSGGMPGTISLLARLPSGTIISVITNTAREQAFTDELFNGLIDAVAGVTDWPTTDLFPQYR